MTRAAIWVAVVMAAVSCRPSPSARDRALSFVANIETATADYDRTRFRSTRRDAPLAAPVTLGHETRRALVPPIPSALTYDVKVPRDPVLRFAIGTSTMGRPVQAYAVSFRILADGEEVFADVVPRARPNAWLAREADLSAWAGKRVRLTFETRGPGDAPQPVVLALWGDPVLAGRADAAPTKLILISIDCLRAQNLGAYGYERDTTPHLDRLAADGVVFETAVSTSSYTHPTHMSMLTGLPPSIHGASRQSRLSEDVPYLPELLGAARFRSDAVVSGPFLSQDFGFDRGFDSYLYEQDPGASRLVDHAVDVLHRGEGQDQFLFLHLFDVHMPYAPPDGFRDRFGPRPDDITALLSIVENKSAPASDTEVEELLRLYDGELAYLDRELGRLFDTLRSMGLYDRALIIVTADHGEAFYEHGFWEHTQTLYEEMVRIPLIVKWPHGAYTGRIVDQVSQTDVVPTLLAHAGAPSPSEWASDLASYLDERAAERSPRVAVIEVTWDPLPERDALMKVALRRHDSKYIATLRAATLDQLYDGGAVVREELYDLTHDPDERANIIDNVDNAARRAYREELEAYLARGARLRRERRGEEVVLDPALRDRLEALGYIER